MGAHMLTANTVLAFGKKVQKLRSDGLCDRVIRERVGISKSQFYNRLHRYRVLSGQYDRSTHVVTSVVV